ncbi:MAG: outer membrane protein assembly factor BamE [Gammaproteobacteria bacterium]|nr:outer membrane protein assembly factor BamE [Gammaproteobacteria bacterium]
MKSVFKSLFAIVLVFQLAACGSKITEDNYKKIKNGMSEDEVVDILGKPTERNSSGIGSLTTTGMAWQGEKISINVQLVNNKVQLKNYSHN